MTTPAWDPWNYREEAKATGEQDLVGFGVHATDGDIGKVDVASFDVGASQIVVDTGPWIFGRKVVLPAGTISHIDWADEKVHVDRSKEEIKNSPELKDVTTLDNTQREEIGTYWAQRYTIR